MDIEISTERLILKNYSLNDFDNIYRLKAEPLVWKFSTKAPTNKEDESKEHLKNVLKNYIEDKYDFEALFLKHTQKYIGEAGIISFNEKSSRAVIGYNLLPKYWNNGYATEITKALVKYLFENKKVERIEGLVMEENRSSRKVLEKSGFVLEGTLRNFASIDNRYFNVCYYGMISQDYEG